MEPVFHVIFLSFSLTATAEQVAETCNGVLAYQQRCLHPKTGQLLLVSAKGGVKCGTENLDRGFTHVFVLEFASREDLQVYLKHEHHIGYDVMLEEKGILGQEMVLDFSPGIF
ncbi:hypothetical protein BKA65DRAFT_80678 [Rhexocercosporidium sp. MPI-PUGE-AT-0058]|nr:hypothetical protein BKA65DRAFT_80678 [Rhexocercosporidium sp. MPI-PUGE-AT-0058]